MSFFKKTDYLINKANLLYLLYFPIFLNFILNIFNPESICLLKLKVSGRYIVLVTFFILINFGKNVSKVFGYRYASTDHDIFTKLLYCRKYFYYF